MNRILPRGYAFSRVMARAGKENPRLPGLYMDNMFNTRSLLQKHA